MEACGVVGVDRVLVLLEVVDEGADLRGEVVAVVEEEKDINTTLLNEKFDYIFFTGGASVGPATVISTRRPARLIAADTCG